MYPLDLAAFRLATLTRDPFPYLVLPGFVRPEAHYYRISNNFQFNSGNIVRLGVSIGYTIGP